MHTITIRYFYCFLYSTLTVNFTHQTLLSFSITTILSISFVFVNVRACNFCDSLLPSLLPAFQCCTLKGSLGTRLSGIIYNCVEALSLSLTHVHSTHDCIIIPFYNLCKFHIHNCLHRTIKWLYKKGLKFQLEITLHDPPLACQQLCSTYGCVCRQNTKLYNVMHQSINY